MNSKLAIKRLTASDLTFFEWHFKHRNAGNQKAINLNADVLIGQLYPALETIMRERQNKLGVDLWIAGPGAEAPINLQRKIIKGATYKNWRLDGEFIYNPEDSPNRFNILRPSDIVLLGLEGELAPHVITLVLIAKEAPQDDILFRRLDEFLGEQRMMALEGDTLGKLCNSLGIPQSHPVWSLASDEDLVEAAVGHAPAVVRLLKRPRAARMSFADLRTARRTAEEIGRHGEELVDIHLRYRLAAGEISSYEWVSNKNAIAPYDFCIERDGSREKLEVKTTAGDFGRVYYLSLNELREMVNGEEVYYIVRVYEASHEGAKLRYSKEIRAFGKIDS